MKEVEQKKRRKVVTKKKRIRGWTLNEQFPYLEALKNLLLSSKPFKRDIITRRFHNAGRVKLLILSGIFIQNDQSRIDVLIVGDYLKKRVITNALKTIESEIGKELRYTILGTDDFLYRLGIYDKFIRDILDFPHEKLIDRIGLK